MTTAKGTSRTDLRRVASEAPPRAAEATLSMQLKKRELISTHKTADTDTDIDTDSQTHRHRQTHTQHTAQYIHKPLLSAKTHYDFLGGGAVNDLLTVGLRAHLDRGVALLAVVIERREHSIESAPASVR